MPQPVIIFGMHRSGTTLVTQLLNDLGLFVGHKYDPATYEAHYFLRLNDWVLLQSGGRWDNPGSISYLLQNDASQKMVQDYLRLQMKSPSAAAYLGYKSFFSEREIGLTPFPWGWKDPRNTFTLQLWLSLFPNSKVIHIYRHGVDVAQSLIVRQERMFQHCLDGYRKKRSLYSFRPKRSAFPYSDRCASLEGAFSLWEEYLNEARKQLKVIGPNTRDVCYEDFLVKPVTVLKDLAEFCGLKSSDEEIERVVSIVNKDRSFAFQKREELISFAREMKSRLELYGY